MNNSSGRAPSGETKYGLAVSSDWEGFREGVPSLKKPPVRMAVATSPAGGLKPPALGCEACLRRLGEAAQAAFAPHSPWLQPPGVGPQHDVATAMLPFA